MDEAAFTARFRRAGEKRPHPGAYPPPPSSSSWERFGSVLAEVGGRMVGPVPAAALQEAVRSVLAELPAGRRVAAAAVSPLLVGIPGIEPIGGGACSPHGLADVEVGILAAELAVAENAALLLSSRTLPARALAFLAEHTIALVPAQALVPDLVTAQARLPVPPPHHLTWVSGPSKTADIEQTLVVGAHGPRTLIVIAYAA